MLLIYGYRPYSIELRYELYSNRLFTDSDALTWSLFSISPLISALRTYRNSARKPYKRHIGSYCIACNPAS